MIMKITMLTCSSLQIIIGNQSRIVDCTDAQTARRLLVALNGTDGTIEAVNAVLRSFKK